MKYKDVRHDMSGFGKPHCWTASCFLKWIQESKAFTHLPDGTIEQWLLGRLELAIFGQRRRSRYEPPKSGVIECTKCRGRGWFGRGRKKCPICNGECEKPFYEPGMWIEPKRFTGYEKRILLASMYELRLIDKLPSFVKRFEDMADWRVKKYPKWLKHLSLPVDYSPKDKKQIMSEIHNAFERYVRKPKVEGKRLMREDVFSNGINLNETLIRLALTFGCTCPITGDFVPPDKVIKLERTRRWDSILYYVSPLGFCARKETYMQKSYEDIYITVSPFSAKGRDIIQRAVTKCEQKLGGEINKEWVLAEVIQSMLAIQPAQLKKVA